MKNRYRLQGMVVLLSLALIVAGCGDDDSQSVGAGGPIPTATPGPILGGVQCDTSDTCTHTNSQLFAIAHAFVDPVNTVYYRVTVPAAPTDTNWGDGTNGFFYQAIVNPGTASASTSTYVPFNGMAVGADNRPMLPQFSFIVAANVASGEQNTTLEIDLCATNYAGGTATVPPCTKRLWTDTYAGLPVPAVGLGPFNVFTPPTVLFDAETGSSVAVPNNGVYPGVLEVCPSLDGSSCAPAGALTDAQLNWFYDHLLFFGVDAKPYTNNIFDDSSAQHRSIGVLPLEEAAYPVSATTYRTRYGSTTSITARDLPDKQFFFYTKNASSTEISVGVQYLYDATQPTQCNGYLNGQGCGSTNIAGDVSIYPAASVSPESGQNGNVEAGPVNPNATAGTVETRSLLFRSQGSGPCTDAVNPLAVNPFGAAADAGDLQPNRPNYVIDDAQNASTLWQKRFPPALYYVLPAGFGNCDPNTEPFCHLTTSYVAYVPQYTKGSTGGVLNGGSTDEPFVDGLTLADQYALPGLSASNQNSLIWFDNCGYGYVYQECKGTVSCANPLGTRKTLPTPPSGHETYAYTVTNSRPGAVVFGKECCASWYQQEQLDQNTTVMVPPVQIHDGFGVFVGSNQSVTYETLFGDEAVVAYDATTGNRLHKLRLNAQAVSAVYGCADASRDANPAAAGCPAAAVTGSNAIFNVQLTDTGTAALACAPVGPCPFGMTPGESGAYTTCTATANSFLLGIPEWTAESLAGVSSVQLRAWGGKGSPGDYNRPSQSGFALTVFTPEDLVNDLYAYVGVGPPGKLAGGSSTILTGTPISSFLQSDMATFESPRVADVILLAGGGGGTICGSLNCDFQGGNGGVAISNAAAFPGEDVSAPGGDATGQYSDPGHGGNKDGRGSGGTAGAGSAGTGNSGVGGWGGGGYGWRSGTLIAPSSWSPGTGQSNGGSYYTAAGGGGFGGGGKGGSNNDGDGGGGGSWAAGNTAHDAYGPPYQATPSSPGGSSGAVQFAYIPGPGTKNVVARAQLTTPAHPQPTDCLGTADAGTILTSQNYSLVWGSNGYLTLNNLGNPNEYNSAIVPPAPSWQSSNSTAGSQVCFQGDGNVVIRESSGAAVWASNTADAEHSGNGGLWMRLDSSCNLVVVNASQTTLFETNTTCSVQRASLTTPSHPQPTECLATGYAGVILTSRYHDLVWGADGYLVLYDANHAPIWKSGNSGPGTNVCFDDYGNLVIYSNAGTAVWAANTADNEHGGLGGAWMQINESCQLAIINYNGATLFHTNTSCTSPPLS